jgi:uncharacterized protein (TIGR01777 family)
VRYAIAGSSGLIGSALADSLAADGHEVIRLVRRPPRSGAELRWDPAAVGGGLEPDALGGIDGAINLAGAPIASGRWTDARKAELRASRIQATTALAIALAAARPRPGALLNGSAIGFYGDRGDQPVDEDAPSGSGFLAELVRDWEAAARAAEPAGIRVAMLRTGIVLAPSGGMLGKLLFPFRLGLGPTLGSGRQYQSWISLADEVRAIRFLLDTPGLAGPVNLTAPNPVTNAEFTAALAAAVRRPHVLRIPAAALRMALGEAAGELLASARVTPRKLSDAGFAFRHPDIGPALAVAAGTGP